MHSTPIGLAHTLHVDVAQSLIVLEMYKLVIIYIQITFMLDIMPNNVHVHYVSKNMNQTDKSKNKSVCSMHKTSGCY